MFIKINNILKYLPLLLPFVISFNRIDIGIFFELKLFYVISYYIIITNFSIKTKLPKYFLFYLIILILHSIFFIFINKYYFYDLLNLYDSIRWKYKAIIVLIKLIILQIPFFISLIILKKKFQWAIILKSYVYGVIFVCFLGILQFILFYIIGRDIFPLGYNENGLGRSGEFIVLGKLILRICSIAGEPRDLALHVILAILIISYFSLSFKKNVLNLIKFLFILTLLLTFSTTGFTLLFIILLFKYIYKIFLLRRLSFRNIFNYKTYFFIILITIFNNYIVEIFHFVFQADKIQNILTEDVDSLVNKFLLNNKNYILTGVGSGNIYLHTFNINDDPNLSYVQDNVIQARYGFRRIIGDQGIFMLFLFLLFLFNKIYIIYKLDHNKYKYPIIFFLATSIVIFLLRDAAFDFLILIFLIITPNYNILLLDEKV